MEAFDVTYGRCCVAGGLEYRVQQAGTLGSTAASLWSPAHSRLRRVPPIQACRMPGTMCGLDPAPSGKRAHQVVTKSHAYRLPRRSSFPQNKSCCVFNNPGMRVCSPPLENLWPAAWVRRVPPCPQPVDSQPDRASHAQPVAAIPPRCHAFVYHPGCTLGMLSSSVSVLPPFLAVSFPGSQAV